MVDYVRHVISRAKMVAIGKGAWRGGGLTLNAPKNRFGGKFVPWGIFFRGEGVILLF